MSETWTLLKVLTWTQGRFAERGIPSARLDAELLLAHVLSCDRVRLYTHFDQPLSERELASYRELIKRRLAGEPVAYLVGKREFRSLELSVDPRVLVPRPETEILVEVALAHLTHLGARAEAGKVRPARILDIGTGSGAVALALKAAHPESRVIAVDRSSEAAEVARANAIRLALDVEVRVGDLFAPVAGEPPFDLVLSNLPYIPTGDLAALPPEVQREPRAALDGGSDGLEVIRRLATEAGAHLVPEGLLALEVGAGQAPVVAALLAEKGYAKPTLTRDLAGIERVVSAMAPTS